MKYIIILTVIIILSSSVVAWERLYGRDEYSEYCLDMARLTDGNFVLVGESYYLDIDPHPCYAYIVKITPDGDEIWSRTYGEGGITNCNAVEPLPDGGFVITGDTETDFGSPGSDKDIYLMRCDSDGDSLWVKTYGTECDDGGLALAVTNDGGFIIAGSTDSTTLADGCYYAIRTDSLGDTLWSKKYIYGHSGYPHFIVATPDSCFAIGGVLNDAGWKGLLFKIDPSGTPLWDKRFGDPDRRCDLRDAIIRQEGGFALTGYQIIGELDTSRIYFAITDSEGDLTETCMFLGAYGNSIVETDDGGFVLAARSDFGARCPDFYILNIDAMGDSLWAVMYHYDDTIVFRRVA